MDDTVFTAMIVEKATSGFSQRIGTRHISELSPGELLVRVHYSSLNYKDALSATGHPGVTRSYPHTPGIDAAGVVMACSTSAFAPGDRVIVTGNDLGVNTDGGYGQFIRIPAAWAVPLPEGLSLRESMALGTAGLTAALSVLRLQHAGVGPDSGDILVTGATGGVGSIGVAILAGMGYRVVAATGSRESDDYLQRCGASSIIGRREVSAGAERPLLPERWGGALDVVGGATLAAILKGTRYGGAVTCCGLVDSPELPLNVFPFILRGVSLLGIDSVKCPYHTRLEIWKKLASVWKPANLEEIATECTLQGLEEQISSILVGRVRGRVVVNLEES